MGRGSSINQVELTCQKCGKNFDSSESICEDCYNEEEKVSESKTSINEDLENRLSALQEKYDSLKAVVCNCTECSSKAVVENL